MSKTIEVDINDSIATITLSRQAAMNTYNEQMAREMLQAIESVSMNDAVRAILLNAKGKVFSAGGDINMFAENLDKMPHNIPEIMEILNETIMLMSTCSKPILASVHGVVAGVGLSFMLAADLVLCADDTRFTLAYAGIGLPCDGGASFTLPRIVGRKKATEMMMLPEIFDAQTALNLGLVNWLVSANDLENETKKYITKLSQGPSTVYKRVKDLLNKSEQNNLEDQLAEEMHAFTECTQTNDFRNGVTAFLKKEKAEFKGN